jgi:hypothetical protein
MKTHSLKTWPSQFEAVKRGDKTFEVRTNTDRDFEVGDTLLLRHWDPALRSFGTFGTAQGSYVGKEGETTAMQHADTLNARVTYILHGGQFGLPVGLCVMSIKLETP